MSSCHDLSQAAASCVGGVYPSTSFLVLVQCTFPASSLAGVPCGVSVNILARRQVQPRRMFHEVHFLCMACLLRFAYHGPVIVWRLSYIGRARACHRIQSCTGHWLWPACQYYSLADTATERSCAVLELFPRFLGET